MENGTEFSILKEAISRLKEELDFIEHHVLTEEQKDFLQQKRWEISSRHQKTHAEIMNK